MKITIWNKLKDFQSRTSRQMKYNKYNVFDLEKNLMKQIEIEV